MPFALHMVNILHNAGIIRNNTDIGVILTGIGSDTMSSPTGLSRRELFIDARDLQSDSDPDNPMTPEEYADLLTNRGKQKLAENQLVQSFEAEVRTYAPTYEYGKDFQMGDTITVTDERLGVTVNTVVRGVGRSVGRQGETFTLDFGYGQPTIFDVLKRKEDK